MFRFPGCELAAKPQEAEPYAATIETGGKPQGLQKNMDISPVHMPQSAWWY